jgi:hypothetical protein
MKKFYFAFLLLVLSFPSLSVFSDYTNPNDPSYNSVGTPNSTSAPGSSPTTYTPGFGFGGIQFNDSLLYDIPPEKCSGTSSAEVIKEYVLTDKVFIFKTQNGYGVAELNQTLKEIETGVRRKKNCPISVGLKLGGEIDCRGVRVIKEEPYEGCAFEAKIWGHSLSEADAFALVYTRLQTQFKEYKDKCVLPPKPKPLSERMLKM